MSGGRSDVLDAAVDAFSGAALLSAAWHLAVSTALTQFADYLVDLSDGDEAGEED